MVTQPEKLNQRKQNSCFPFAAGPSMGENGRAHLENERPSRVMLKTLARSKYVLDAQGS